MHVGDCRPELGLEVGQDLAEQGDLAQRVALDRAIGAVEVEVDAAEAVGQVYVGVDSTVAVVLPELDLGDQVRGHDDLLRAETVTPV